MKGGGWLRDALVFAAGVLVIIALAWLAVDVLKLTNGL